MVKELGTLSKDRPTALDEKRRIQRELGLPEEPAFVFPKGSVARPDKPGVWARLRAWLRGPDGRSD